MYIESVPNRGSPPAILLRESYRDGGKVKKRTLLTDLHRSRRSRPALPPVASAPVLIVSPWAHTTATAPQNLGHPGTGYMSMSNHSVSHFVSRKPIFERGPEFLALVGQRADELE
jgi:hypothetical protein